ncbi:MAG: tetratricopeptide repeat protein [Chloroflexi bacterium]|nr:tetratricopeptide repeat protein [Chloroflexota bacterium]MCI0579908.1 tetratricopeptide repeat protein [Chloroflexota bacterium]MCI0646491.1 tetratricopeptide repeat protein [Chloroflexota bacterium]MCI0726157.1 tetratricopeptide repeat protein [Chloroflexota bacterium]
MAKRKKRKTAKKYSPALPSRKLERAVDEATELFEEGDYDEAEARLVKLAERYPGSKLVLTALTEVYLELEDWSPFARYSEQLLPLERGPDQAATLNNIIVAYTQLMYPALAWQAAKKIISQHPDFPDIDKARALAQKLEEFLREQAAELPGTADLAPDEQMEMMVQHDRIRFYTESGQPKLAIAAAEALLEKVPTFIPILNNLSLSHFVTGDVERAIAVAQQVLAQAPDNFHALANLTRYTFLTGQFEAARQHAARLKQLAGSSADLVTKQAEALSFLGDDEGIRQVYQRAKKGREQLSPLLLHLAATAHYRLGDEKKAWRLWREAIKQQPSFSLARACLDDEDLPVGERDIPWYWPLPYWLPASLREELKQFAASPGRTKDNKAAEKAARALLDKYPSIAQLAEHMLERGDHSARGFVINFARLAETPELANPLYHFALGRYGSDDLRMQALQFVSDHRPELLPEDKKVPFWTHGQQTEIFFMGFEIYYEPETPEELADDFIDKYSEAYDLLLDGRLEEAEQLFKEVMATAPDFPSAYNQLAVVYERQGRREEARALVEETHARFPDYPFARIALARLYALEKRTEEAKELVGPILGYERLHISEFRALAQAHMEIALAEGNKEGARSWLNMWADVEDDHPDLLQWRVRVEGADLFLQDLKKMAGRFGKKSGGRRR